MLTHIALPCVQDEGALQRVLTALLSTCIHLHVLVTSTVTVGEVPDVGQQVLEIKALSHLDAARLFLNRATRDICIPEVCYSKGGSPALQNKHWIHTPRHYTAGRVHGQGVTVPCV